MLRCGPCALLCAAIIAMPCAAEPTTGTADLTQSQLAARVIEAQDGPNFVETIKPAFVSGLSSYLRTAATEAKEPLFPLTEFISAEVEKLAPRMKGAQVSAYSETLSRPTLEGMLAFFTSPAYVEYRQKQPVLAQRTGLLVGGYYPEVLSDLYDAVCSRRACTSEQRQALRIASVTGAAVSAPTPATASEADVPANAIKRPTFAKRPSAEEIATFYPARAVGLAQEGQARLLCDVGDGGEVSGCRVLSESPPGSGFGLSATEVASLFVLDAVDSNGIAVAGRKLVLSMKFSQPKSTPIPSTPTGSTLPSH